MSYNLHDYGKSAVATRRDQHELLRSQCPDVVCLQEIWDEDDNLGQLLLHVGSLCQALGMRALAVPAPRTHCHMAILWRAEYVALSQRARSFDLWHGLGLVQLDVGAAVPLRVAVTHLSPWDPEKRFSDAHTVAGMLDDPAQATVVAADWNSIGAEDSYDPEPDWARLRPGRLGRHVRWSDDPQAPPRMDRRPAQLLHRSGLSDAAPCLRARWQATGGYTDGDMPRRLDAFWTTRPQALRDYQVLDTSSARRLSDHLPIRVDLAPEALDVSAVPPAGPLPPVGRRPS